jgi:hypothetical protein
MNEDRTELGNQPPEESSVGAICGFCIKHKSCGYGHRAAFICKKCVNCFDDEDEVDTQEDVPCHFCEETKLNVFVGKKASICTDCKSTRKEIFTPREECTADEID